MWMAQLRNETFEQSLCGSFLQRADRTAFYALHQQQRQNLTQLRLRKLLRRRMPHVGHLYPDGELPEHACTTDSASTQWLDRRQSLALAEAWTTAEQGVKGATQQMQERSTMRTEAG